MPALRKAMLVLTASVVLVLGLAPTSAFAAATTCSVSGDVMSVVLPDGASRVTIVGGSLTVSEQGVVVTCTGDRPSSTTIATLEVGGGAGSEGALTLDSRSARFGPGPNPEPDGSPAMAIHLGAAIVSLSYVAGPSGARLTRTASGLNLDTDNDTDLSWVTEPESLVVVGTEEWDVVDLSVPGGAATSMPVTVYGNGGSDQITGSSAGGTLLGGEGDDTLVGGGAADTITAGPGADSVDAGGGDDTLEFAPDSTGGDDVHGGGGSDTLRVVGGAGGSQSSTISPNDVNDDGWTSLPALGTSNVHSDIERFLLGASTDYFTGGPTTTFVDATLGSMGDFIYPGGGSGSIAGNGRTRLLFTRAPGPVTVELDAGTATGYGNLSLTGIGAVAGGDHNDVLTGDAGDNELSGAAGDDLISGGEGADTILGGLGNDVLYAGAGNDNVIGDYGDDVLHGEAGNDQLAGGPGTDQLMAGDGDDGLAVLSAGLVDGGPGTDFATFPGRAAGVSVNLATGTVAGSTVRLAGVEDAYGTSYADTFVGSIGANKVEGGGGLDTFSYAGRASGVSVMLNGAPVSGASGERDTLGSIERVIGTSYNDVFRTTRRDVTFVGGAGNDVYVAPLAKLGGVVFSGGSGTDTADYRARTGALAVTLDNSANDGLAYEADNVKADVENVYAGSGTDRLTGSSAANRLLGFAGNDVLSGLAGTDVLDGGTGNDVIYAADKVKDTVVGGSGTDAVKRDTVDAVYGCERFL